MDTAGISEAIGAKCFFWIATHAQGVPIHGEVLWGNRADSKTLVGFLLTLQGRLGIQERTSVFHGGRKKPQELGSAPRRGASVGHLS
ncbi:hypothetical protein [Candidatus Methylacidithermus pantelleriae]|uniref:Transposase n=1 Tax=Candidatus Methylacidithermus pantelleriae TaxID=2744239 RepID=A0A8J2BKP4_9BACT|nr:hypothetical protein [Candidatus Methylacidithermus pantelleriae]CAF0703309.1 hypothetical protein MPNT_550005 [Candidatus Methylacidithermus pantelleriae]